MKIQELTIVDGIVQDKTIGGIPLKLAIIEPSGKRNVRTLIKMTNVRGVTNHNTANTSATAGDEAHAKYFNSLEKADTKYVGAHFFVDYDSITQVLPINEASYNAGDGKGDGNYKTVSVEICENKEILKAEANAKVLNAALILTYPHFEIYKHQDWSGKFCPRVILNRTNGWEGFKTSIRKMVAENMEENNVKPIDEVVPTGYAEAWTKAVASGVEDGFGPNEIITSAKLMAYFDKIGLLDILIALKGATNNED